MTTRVILLLLCFSFLFKGGCPAGGADGSAPCWKGVSLQHRLKHQHSLKINSLNCLYLYVHSLTGVKIHKTKRFTYFCQTTKSHSAGDLWKNSLLFHFILVFITLYQFISVYIYLKTQFEADILLNKCDSQGHFVSTILSDCNKIPININIYGFNSKHET